MKKNIRQIYSKVLKKNWINFEHGYLFKSSIDKLWMKVDGAVVELRVDTSQSNIDTKELKGKKIFPPSYYFTILPILGECHTIVPLPT